MSTKANLVLRTIGSVTGVVGLIALLAGVCNQERVHAAPTLVTGNSLENPDEVCRDCHQQIYDRYGRSAMAKASGNAMDGLNPQQRSSPDFRHGPSNILYHLSDQAGHVELTFTRSSGDGGSALNGKERLEYFIGSGHRGRTYLYQQEGFWFESPINWYGKKQVWDMAPAYTNATAMPGPLPVDPNCLHCHTGDVQLSQPPARNRFAAQPFRAAGIGCASCHGDPTTHLAANHGRPGTGAILNPAKLTPSKRDSICLQCHLEGDAAIYRAGRSLATFRPGEELSASVVYFIDNNRIQLGRRATSQYEALLRSACKRTAGDKLTCTNCHDPHGSPAASERVEFFRSKCLTCHTNAAMTTHHPEQRDCATCHMPTRDTADISHEQLTDHDIESRPASKPLILATLGKFGREPDLVPVLVGDMLPGDRELGLAYAQLARHGDRASGEKALLLLSKAERSGCDDAELHDELGFLLQLSGDRNGARAEYLSALRIEPHDTLASANLAVLIAASGSPSRAMLLLSSVIETDPSQTAAGLNLAYLQCRSGSKSEASHTLERMLQFNPDSPEAHRFLDSGEYGGQHCSLR
jgi:predicted CXXCH cytochrome family protein